MSTVFRHGAGHDAQKAALAGSAGRLTDRLVRRRGRTGSMLAVRWPTPRPPAADRAAFALALAQAAPSLGLGVDSDLVVSMLRAVERHRGASATALPAAAATWHRMSSRNAALCHGDYHPGQDPSQLVCRLHGDDATSADREPAVSDVTCVTWRRS